MLTAARARSPSHRTKAQFSLALNFLSRAPSFLGLLFFIPLIHEGLGDARYGELMAAMALGGLASVLFSGGNILGRRRIGEAMLQARHEQEARAFRTLARASLLAALTGAVAAAAYAVWEDRGTLFFAIAMLPIINGLTGAMDEARAAYNEHYFTAGAQICFQILAYALGLGIGWVSRNPLAAALVMIGPGIFASLLTGAFLLIRRPYLLHGSAPPAWRALGEGLPIGLIDGLVMMAVNFSVVMVQTDLPPEAGAWYVTIVRLFMIALAPVLLTLVPLTSYIRGIWDQHHASRQSRIMTAWLAVSLLYGTATALALWLANTFYVDRAMGVAAPMSQLQALPIYAGLGAVVVFKCFSGLSYMVLGPRRLNLALGVTLTVSLAAAILGHVWHGVLAAVQSGGAAFAIGLPLAILAVHSRGAEDTAPER
ncbi:hypothetical protein [Novosphingobium album (ex Liu et al. 2023)]|uniref:Polysaccharide biosynthesis protein n=1 Tax=Novosphingobium album (ex Liu et al. 2023) TaxID=3031130 RepID=A0ABT5WMF7_9SPHN|nr:hypothetical protein [Novosphingobium album (ex Liu et al. 2023)]MDE8650472.1 hypothetical protein [Novosphingobium album (ex Liu et al. 2023)]